jgi:DnaJ domain
MKGWRDLMGFHSFSLDPRTVLGVSPDASLEEIHDAYRAKSKKHHPDCGGDEWAFRMVTRAYEVLSTTAAPAGAVNPWEGRTAEPDVIARGRSAEWSWSWGSRFGQAGWGAGMGAGGTTDAGRPDEADARGPEATTTQPGAAPDGSEEARLDPGRLRSVDVELIWTRFEKDRPARLLSQDNNCGDDATLSVCMVISWPDAELVDRTAEFPGGAEILRTLIDLFERLRKQDRVVAARSRIEDGRFVGWLSYPDVLTAQDAVLAVRETFRSRGLIIKLQTRDERIPFDWHGQPHSPAMSQAS